ALARESSPETRVLRRLWPERAQALRRRSRGSCSQWGASWLARTPEAGAKGLDGPGETLGALKATGVEPSPALGVLQDLQLREHPLVPLASSSWEKLPLSLAASSPKLEGDAQRRARSTRHGGIAQGGNSALVSLRAALRAHDF